MYDLTCSVRDKLNKGTSFLLSTLNILTAAFYTLLVHFVHSIMFSKVSKHRAEEHVLSWAFCSEIACLHLVFLIAVSNS